MDRDLAGKLLLVEDEHVLRRLIAQFLRAEKFEVVEAADGIEGFALFRARGPFDLVLLDLNLPGISGVEVCRRIKAERPAQPVMICSAAILDHHIEALHAMDVDRFLTKPCHPLELLRQIASAIDPVGVGTGFPPGASEPFPAGSTRFDGAHRASGSARALVKLPVLD